MTLLLTPTTARPADQIRMGVGFEGPFSGVAMYDIEQLVGSELKVHTVPIVPPGSLAACAKRFVGGEADDRLDGVIVFRLPPDSFKTEREAKEVKFSGTYEIYTLDLTTMQEN